MRSYRLAMIRAFAFEALIAGALAGAGCDGDTTPVVCQGELSDTAAGRTVESFVQTWNALLVAASEIDRDMLNVCRSMAKDLALPSSALAASSASANSPGAETQAACARVKQEIDLIVKNNLPVNARLGVVNTPVTCGMDLDARLRCEQQCDPTTSSISRLSCVAEKSYGACMDSCKGTCTGACGAGGCSGSCTGTCTGSCAGNCNGRCDGGSCVARNADGTCFGPCAGTCVGTCDGTCAGTCSATCGGTCASSCLGTCEGTCATWVTPPLCAAPRSETTVDACRSNCDARSRFEAACADPAVAASYGVNATPSQRNQLDRLVAALRASYAHFVEVGYRATTVVGGAAAGFSTALEAELEPARQAGPQAAACVSQAIPLVADALTRLDISVAVHASLTTSISAMGGLAPSASAP